MIVGCGSVVEVLPLLLEWVNEIDAPPQPPSVPIAANARVQRGRYQARAVAERARSQGLPADTYTFDEDVRVTRRLRPIKIILRIPVSMPAVPVRHDARAGGHYLESGGILIRFRDLANLSPSAHVAELRQANDMEARV